MTSSGASRREVEAGGCRTSGIDVEEGFKIPGPLVEFNGAHGTGRRGMGKSDALAEAEVANFML